MVCFCSTRRTVSNRFGLRENPIVDSAKDKCWGDCSLQFQDSACGCLVVAFMYVLVQRGCLLLSGIVGCFLFAAHYMRFLIAHIHLGRLARRPKKGSRDLPRAPTRKFLGQDQVSQDQHTWAHTWAPGKAPDSSYAMMLNCTELGSVLSYM